MIYLDNASTTPIDASVLNDMMHCLKTNFGNPSSLHHVGRKAKATLEESRKAIAGHLRAQPNEIYFTSGGTESNNWVLRQCVENLNIKYIISTQIEHSCVLKTISYLCHTKNIKCIYIPVDSVGRINIDELNSTVMRYKGPQTLVSLMHANNEIGNLIPIDEIANICYQNGVLFHSDTVQTIAHYAFDLSKTPITFMSGSAHKFHGPKGIGFAYVRKKKISTPLIIGGGQERNMRSGTEHLAGIVGLSKAMDIAYMHLEKDTTHIQSLKTYMIKELQTHIPDVAFNGDIKNSLYTILNVRLPQSIQEMILFNLDIAHIAASGGSACQSGANKPSHVLENINAPLSHQHIRFSFSKYNSYTDIDYTIEILKKYLKKRYVP